MDPLVGREIGGVRIESKLGSGGMGSVYLGFDLQSGGEQRALKLLSITAPDYIQERFQREGKIGYRLRHPLLVAVQRYGVADDFHYLVMDYVQGEDLGHVITRSAPMDWPTVSALGRDLGRALRTIHTMGMVHRDLKPANVMLDQAGRVRLADFGLASWRDAPVDEPGVSLTATGDAFGTPMYMAPEQFRDAKTAGPPADVYSLGVVLFEALCGRVPFHASTIDALARLHKEVAPPALDALAADSPERLRALIGRMLEKGPADRPDAKEVSEILGELVREASKLSPVPLELPDGTVASWAPEAAPDSMQETRDLPEQRQREIESADRKEPPPEAAAQAGQAETPAPQPAGPGQVGLAPPRRSNLPLLVLAAVVILAGLGAVGFSSPEVRIYLASEREQEQFALVQEAQASAAANPQGFLDALNSYRREFGATSETPGLLAKHVEETLYRRPFPLKGGKRFCVPAHGLDHPLILIEGGEYEIGREDYEGREHTQRRQVRLAGYLIDQFEVSNALYQSFLYEWQAAGRVHRCGDPSADHSLPLRAFQEAGVSPHADGPVVGCTLFDAREYAAFRAGHLPSEEEWEVAASFDSTEHKLFTYPWGDQPPGPDQAYLANLSFAGSGSFVPSEENPEGEFLAQFAQVGLFQQDRSPFGLYDVAGNAAEWCEKGGTVTPGGPQALRGGSIETTDPEAARLTARRLLPASERPADAGFRVVLPYTVPR